MQRRYQHAGEHRGDHADNKSWCGTEHHPGRCSQHRLQEGADQPADECAREHDALDTDVDDARSLAYHAAHRGEADRHGDAQDDRRNYRQLRDQVADQLEDHADDRNVVQDLQRVHYETASFPYVLVIVVSLVPNCGLTPPSLNRRRSTGLATRNRRIVACMTSTISLGTPDSSVIKPAPWRRPPNSSAASRTPNGVDRPSSAIAIEP